MNDDQAWERHNARYLSAALAWVRARLERLAASGTPVALPTVPAPPVTEGGPQIRRPWYRRRRGSPPERAGRPALPPAPQGSLDAMVAQAQAAMDAAASEASKAPPALLDLGARLGLSGFERSVLLLCASMELDTRIPQLCASAQGRPDRAYPTFALALTLFDDPSWDVLSPERPLRYWRLVEISQAAGQPLTSSPISADERIVSFLKGLNYHDDRLTPLLLPLAPTAEDLDLPPSQQEVVARAIGYIDQAGVRSPGGVVQLLGSDSPSKQLVARAVAASLAPPLAMYRLPVDLLPPQPAELETLARLWHRESVLLPVGLYVEAGDLAGGSDGPGVGLNRFLARIEGVVMLDASDVWSGFGRASLAVDVSKPTQVEQRGAWARALGPLAGGAPDLLAGQFDLSLSAIRATARPVLAAGSTGSDPDLWDSCLAATRPRLDVLAQRLDPKATWADIVLPEQELGLLRQVAAQVGHRTRVYESWGFARRMNRGLGISALFAGDSGTGKTMAAEVIANDLRLNLYRIDLSAVVSKYIGETEKNLKRLFDAAEDGGAILFFDEADALFGKRSEVKDSHDRYANIEINYLLQRMESYRGLAVMATNMKSALDPAFLRRLRFVVNFPFPGPSERRSIWQRAFPPQTPVDGLDSDRLSRLNLTGGSIHNVALNAAFLAAQSGGRVGMPMLMAAARTEFRKLDRPVNEADLAWKPAEVVA